MNTTSGKQDPDLIKGVVAGIAGGLLASFLMEQFQALWSGIAAETTNKAKKTSSAGEEPATVKAANAISLRTWGRSLSEASQPIAAEAVHYAVGAASGGIYGGLAEMIPTLEVGEGLGFGAGLWLIADEVTGVETVQTADGVSYLDACLRARVPPHLWVGDGAGAARGSPSTL